MSDAPALAEVRIRALGDRVRHLRTSLNMSQEQLAHAAGLHRAFIGFVERGERDFGVSHIWPLAQALGVAPGDLFPESVDPSTA